MQEVNSKRKLNFKQDFLKQKVNQITNSEQIETRRFDNHFQASFQQQRNLLLNMEQQSSISIYTPSISGINLSNLNDKDKIMDIIVDNNNNMTPANSDETVNICLNVLKNDFSSLSQSVNVFEHQLFGVSNRIQQTGSLPSINELKNSKNTKKILNQTQNNLNEDFSERISISPTFTNSETIFLAEECYRNQNNQIKPNIQLTNVTNVNQNSTYNMCNNGIINSNHNGSINNSYNQFPTDQNPIIDEDDIMRFEEDDNCYNYDGLSNASVIYDNYDIDSLHKIKMEDAFQVDKLDLKSSPTLAELNLNDDDGDNLDLKLVNPNSVLCASMPIGNTSTCKNESIQNNNNSIDLPTTSCPNTKTTTSSICQNNRNHNYLDRKPIENENLTLNNDHLVNNYNNNQHNHLMNQTTLSIENDAKTSENLDEYNNYLKKSQYNHNLIINMPNSNIYCNNVTSITNNNNNNNNSLKDNLITNKTLNKQDKQNNKQNTTLQQYSHQNEDSIPNIHSSQNNQVLCKLLNENKMNENFYQNTDLANSGTNLNQNSLNDKYVNSTLTLYIKSNNNSLQTASSLSPNNNNPHFTNVQVSTFDSTSVSKLSSLPNLYQSNKSTSPLLNSSSSSLSPLSPSSLQTENNNLSNNLHYNNQIALVKTNFNSLRSSSSIVRHRNSSISTEHSFSSSHDEGFISQTEEESDEKEDENQQGFKERINKLNTSISKTRRKRTRKECNKDKQNINLSISNDLLAHQSTVNNRSANKKVKINQDDNLIKASSSGFSIANNLPTVKEEPNIKLKEETSGIKKRVNHKITKVKENKFLNQIENKTNIVDKNHLEDKQLDEDSSDDEDDESFYDNYEANDLIGATTSDDQLNKWSLNMGRSRKNSAQRYFWQYNVQSKGPKGTKLATSISDYMDGDGEQGSSNTNLCSDLEPSDPVFSPNCQIEGVKHAGKARRGDGNDLTPNPRKLLMIGLELKKLSKTINDLTPVAEVSVNSKSSSRKEKNKLASRACRLKKKAQHEANKIKLHGLSVEYRKLMIVLNEYKKIFEEKMKTKNKDTNISYGQLYLNLLSEKGPSISVAGQTTEFVNSILDSVSSGNINGGLEKL